MDGKSWLLMMMLMNGKMKLFLQLIGKQSLPAATFHTS
ncbi:hypothetical protein Goklo_001487 [Gossypium klotzschianum]|uniref:Uncharacterized protein n=1 Tax=Gossypium klotzschianum TaxID=34286 RepID=A0A7J8W128_9ROSI|nr:hypothetical protein [Gossypium klotzschianum]